MRKRPGEVRDAIVRVLEAHPQGASVYQITNQVTALIGSVPASSIRSYLRLNTPELFARMNRAQYALTHLSYEPSRTNRRSAAESFSYGKATLINDDCLTWLEAREANSIHAVVT